MKAADLRVRFLQVVERFNSGEFDIPAFWEEVEVLNRAGLHQAFKGEEEERAVSQLTWALDLYDAGLQPRPGVVGRTLDAWGGLVRDENRVSTDEVRARALMVERILKNAR
jgi:hypothetical protein